MAGVIGFLGLLWFVSRDTGADWRMSIGNLFWAIMILSLGGIHVLAIFSQILSNGRNLLGAVSLVMLYAGAILLVVVDHLSR